ncbi:MAG: DUF86 domain-containing protein [archaeon]
MKEKEDIVFINHVLDSINAIVDYSKNMDKEDLVLNRMKQSAIVREIEIIGEASKNISNSVRKKYFSVPWRDIIGTRDKIIHKYFEVDLDMIWEIIKKDIPELKKEILKIKEDMEK